MCEAECMVTVPAHLQVIDEVSSTHVSDKVPG